MTTPNIRVLSVGHGDFKISFDNSDHSEKKRAQEVITDLIRKGYALMVEVGQNEKGPILQRVHGFDPETSEYLVFGDSSTAPQAPEPRTMPAQTRGRKKKQEPTRIPASRPAIAVARSAGGYDPVLPSRISRGASLRTGGAIL